MSEDNKSVEASKRDQKSKDQKCINIETSAHYYTHGTLSKKTKHIWIALHGYGQTGEYMQGKLSFLDPEDHFVISPQGLNSFYWHSNNEPVACWMTKMNRYHEITDFVTFLDKLYDRYCKHVNQNTKVHLIGFSQGCATIWRWIHATQPRFDTLTNWAGWIPEDIGYLHIKDYLSDKFMFMHYGTNDKFITAEAMKGIQEVIDKNKLNIAVSTFEGKHHMPNDMIEEFVNNQILKL